MISDQRLITYKDTQERSNIIAHQANQSFATGPFPSIEVESGNARTEKARYMRPQILSASHQPDNHIEDTCTGKIYLQQPEITLNMIFELLCAPVSLSGCAFTEMALVRVVDDILCKIDSVPLDALIDLDISATFDTVNHDMLLRWLQSKLEVSGTPQ